MAKRDDVSDAYDEKTELPAEWKSWPTAPRAAAIVGCSVRHLVRQVERGVIDRYKAIDNTFRYNPAELEDAKDAIRTTSGDNEQELVISEGFKSGTELVKQSHKHSAEMFALYKDPIHQLLEMYQTENEKLRGRVEKLEAVRDEMAAKREELISEQHIRDVLTAKLGKAEDRKDRAFGLFIDRVPGLLGKLEESALGSSKEVKATIELLKGFDRESLAMLLETEILTEEQKAHVRTILGMPQAVPKVKPDEPEEPPATTVETTAEESPKA